MPRKYTRRTPITTRHAKLKRRQAIADKVNSGRSYHAIQDDVVSAEPFNSKTHFKRLKSLIIGIIKAERGEVTQRLIKDALAAKANYSTRDDYMLCEAFEELERDGEIEVNRNNVRRSIYSIKKDVEIAKPAPNGSKHFMRPVMPRRIQPDNSSVYGERL